MRIEADRAALARAASALDGSRVVDGALELALETSDPAEAARLVARVGEAARTAPKDFK